jgi:type II secretion system protein N
VTTVFINQLEVDVHFLPLLSGAASARIDATIGPGHLRGTARISKGGTKVAFEGENLQSQMLPMREAIGLPMSGMVEFEVDLDLPNEKLKSGKTAPNWQKAEGSARIACPSGCTFGDGKTKLKTKLKNQRNQAFAADGIEFGKVNLKSMLAKVEINTGQLKITQFDTSSDDGTLYVDYMMELEPVFADSLVIGCLRFNGSQALLQREPKTFSAITATGAPLGPDQLFHIKLADKFKDMKRLPQVCGSAVSSKSMDNPGARPTLTVPTEEPAKVVDAGIPTPPTITPPPTTPPPEPAAGAAAGSAATVPVPGPDQPGSAAAGPGSAEVAPPPPSGEVR